MKFSDVKFTKSVGINSKTIYIDESPEVIFVGRSNVGKSSIMNALFEKKDLVKTSSRPGKTKLANLFTIENKYICTDLPGYWFAKLWKNLKEMLDQLISWYVDEKRENLKMVVMLIDAKLWAQEVDVDMYKYLLELGLPITIVLSKADKISKNEIAKSKNHAMQTFFGQEVIAVSSLKKQGVDELRKILKQALLSK